MKSPHRAWVTVSEFTTEVPELRTVAVSSLHWRLLISSPTAQHMASTWHVLDKSLRQVGCACQPRVVNVLPMTSQKTCSLSSCSIPILPCRLEQLLPSADLMLEFHLLSRLDDPPLPASILQGHPKSLTNAIFTDGFWDLQAVLTVTPNCLAVWAFPSASAGRAGS